MVLTGTLPCVDPHYPPEAEEYREKVRAFLGEHLPAGWKGIGALDHERARQFTADWRRTLYGICP